MHDRATRRHQAKSHMLRRLKEDRNQHYRDLNCACYAPGKRMAQFKEQPKLCDGGCCANPRRRRGLDKERLTIQELKAKEAAEEEMRREPRSLGP